MYMSGILLADLVGQQSPGTGSPSSIDQSYMFGERGLGGPHSQQSLMDMLNNAKLNMAGPLNSDLVNANLHQSPMAYQPMFKANSKSVSFLFFILCIFKS